MSSVQQRHNGSTRSWLTQHVTDIRECPLGQALRAVREGNRPKLDWSRIPLGRFTTEHALRSRPQNISQARRERWAAMRLRAEALRPQIRAALGENCTLVEAAQWLNERGVRSPNGARWQARSIANYAQRLGLRAFGAPPRLSRRRQAALAALEIRFRAALDKCHGWRAIATWLDARGVKPPRSDRWCRTSILYFARRFGITL